MFPKEDNERPFASLRTFLDRQYVGENHCELCGAGMASHSHLLELKTRKVVCSCEPCAILFSNREAATYRRIPHAVRQLSDFRLTDEEWDALAIPINMAFFCVRADSEKPAVFYPSPAGATESLLPLESWRRLAANNPIVTRMEAEVECLLVNRITKPSEYYLAPIDDCYRLVGLIRSRWRGFAGGKEAWKEIGVFFLELRQRSTPRAAAHDSELKFSD